MSLDPYSLCPCGSGKKLKFCCFDIAADMLKALQLHEGGQSRAALKILEKLHSQQPARAWVATSLSGVFLFLEEPFAARDALKPLLQENPDHPLGRILDATAALDIDGYAAARPVVHRAFTKGVKAHPEMVGSLIAEIASLMYEEMHHMAARQHLALAMRFVREEDRQAVFLRMLDFDGDISIPYPLRSIHNLKTPELPAEDQATYKKATSLSSLGCWHEAAAVTLPLTQKYPENTDLIFNCGLFYAWDGDESRAAVQFHRAAELTTDREFAIYCETLAQVLEQSEELVGEKTCFYGTDSPARLLSTLDEVKFLIRRNDPQQTATAVDITSYLLLDREPGDIPDSLKTVDDLDRLPKIVGSVVCMNTSMNNLLSSNDEVKAVCRVVVNPAYSEDLLPKLEQIAGSQFIDIGSPPAGMSENYEEWKDFYGLYENYYVPESTPRRLVAELEYLHRQQVENNRWLNRPLRGLNGHTPLEAKDQPELSLKLAAALNVFDAYANISKYQINLEQLRTRLGLPDPTPYEITQDSQLNTCDVLQMLRIPVESLPESQLALLLNRAQLNQHVGFNERLLGCVLKFPQIVDQQRMAQILHAYIDIARENFDMETAYERIQLARNWAAESGQKFEDTLQWEIRELQLRMLEPQSEKLTSFLNELYSRFLRKLPELEAVVIEWLGQHGITPPWNSSPGILLAGSGSSLEKTGWKSEGLTPEQPAKLWLPGQR